MRVDISNVALLVSRSWGAYMGHGRLWCGAYASYKISCGTFAYPDGIVYEAAILKQFALYSNHFHLRLMGLAGYNDNAC